MKMYACGHRGLLTARRRCRRRPYGSRSTGADVSAHRRRVGGDVCMTHLLLAARTARLGHRLPVGALRPHTCRWTDVGSQSMTSVVYCARSATRLRFLQRRRGTGVIPVASRRRRPDTTAWPGRIGPRPGPGPSWLALVRPVYYSTVYRVDGVSIARRRQPATT